MGELNFLIHLNFLKIYFQTYLYCEKNLNIFERAYMNLGNTHYPIYSYLLCEITKRQFSYG
jgi:hypothetical protein